MIFVAIYCRYSDDNQKDGYSIEHQLEKSREFAKTKDNWVVYKEYIDEAVSGKTDKRDAFQQMIQDATQHKFSVLIADKYDRLGRSHYDQMFYEEKLKKLGIVFYASSQIIDHSNPYSKILKAILQANSEVDNINRAMETMKGLVQGAKRGFYQSGQPPYGYKTKKVDYKDTKKTKLSPHPTEKLVIQQIFNLYEKKNLGLKSICETLKSNGIRNRLGRFFSPNTISHILRNKVYLGTIEYNKDRKYNFDIVHTENAHTAIIEKTQFNKVQLMIQQRKTTPHTPNSVYILSGLLECSDCGAPMQGYSAYNRTKTKYEYYKCQNKIKRNTCSSCYIPRDTIEKAIKSKLKDRILNKTMVKTYLTDLINDIKTIINSKNAELETVKAQRADVDKKYNRLIDVIQNDDILDMEIIAPRLKELKSQLDVLIAREKNLAAECEYINSVSHSKSEIKKYFLNFLDEKTENLDFLNKDNVKDIIKRITVDDNVIKIEYNFSESMSEQINCSEWNRNGSPYRNLFRTFFENKSYVIELQLAA